MPVRRSFSVLSALMLAAACSLFGGVDDLEGDAKDASPESGGTAGSAASDAAGGSGGGAGAVTDGSSGCTPDKGCLGCATCADYCQCARPFAADACIAQCADAGNTDSGTPDASSDAPNLCDPALILHKSCNEVPSSVGCSACLVTQCCFELDTCFDHEGCAGYVSCVAKSCSDLFDTQCGLDECANCFGAGASKLFDISNCAQTSCNTECISSG